jgi:hypothetical protein
MDNLTGPHTTLFPLSTILHIYGVAGVSSSLQIIVVAPGIELTDSVIVDVCEEDSNPTPEALALFANCRTSINDEPIIGATAAFLGVTKVPVMILGIVLNLCRIFRRWHTFCIRRGDEL